MSTTSTLYRSMSLWMTVISIATPCQGFGTPSFAFFSSQLLQGPIYERALHCLFMSADASDVDSSEPGRLSDAVVERERQRLEDLNTQSFLKKRTRKLPYEAARKWIQANLGASTREEFMDLVENGNVRTPYIPKRPDEYYSETREWISWDHFLTGIFDDEQPSTVRPQTGVFD